MSEYPATVLLSTLNGTTGFVINGIDVEDRLGRSVAGAGDLNDDGFADIIIGAPDADPNGDSGGGESYLIFGKASWAASLDLAALGADGVRLDGIDAGDASGVSVSGAGEPLNGPTISMFCTPISMRPDSCEVAFSWP